MELIEHPGAHATQTVMSAAALQALDRRNRVFEHRGRVIGAVRLKGFGKARSDMRQGCGFCQANVNHTGIMDSQHLGQPRRGR
jgi:hypothetical protein